MFKLVIQDDEGKTTVVPLIRDEITIGRKEGNTIRLTERNVSRRHARILRNNGEVQIEDLGSYNGIRVNNARIAERVALRVSDQVQIGDYKLYLKAEVEQVDDSRTLPMDRVTDQSTTNIMPVPLGNGTPTLPMGVPQTNGAALGGQQVPGLANRGPVATADTDPAGRPIATAAAVAALTTPVGYGKLVVLSSNFAGKEFELSRPQMIIGRTDENDIVINHRSISRNHAKLVRETETGRYTISDLQSSNGVRVNGQDYGKVELRRGDVVDLGHVRLRFVDEAEDFVFARDAVITDVPDVGGKKGLVFAIIAALLVLGAAGVYLATSGEKKPDDNVVTPVGSGTNGLVDPGSGSQAGDGSNGSTVAVVKPDTGSGSAAAATTTNVADDLRLECSKLAVARDWANLLDCSERLATADPEKAKAYKSTAVLENTADMARLKLDTALKNGNFKVAKSELDKIPKDSVYKAEAVKRYTDAAADAESDYAARARTASGDPKKCRDLQREARDKGVGDKAAQVRCQEAVATKPSNPPPGTGSDTAIVAKVECDADALRQRGSDHYQTGMVAAALTAFESSLRCKPDYAVTKLAFMAACRSKNAARAKHYYARLNAKDQSSMSQMCIGSGIQVP